MRKRVREELPLTKESPIQYIINNEEIGRSEFYKKLRLACTQEKMQMVIAGWHDTSTTELNKPLFNKSRRNILSGTEAVFGVKNNFTEFKANRPIAALPF